MTLEVFSSLDDSMILDLNGPLTLGTRSTCCPWDCGSERRGVRERGRSAAPAPFPSSMLSPPSQGKRRFLSVSDSGSRRSGRCAWCRYTSGYVATVEGVSTGVNVFIKPLCNPLSQAKNMQGFILLFMKIFILGRVVFASNRCTWYPSGFFDVLATFV